MQGMHLSLPDVGGWLRVFCSLRWDKALPGPPPPHAWPRLVDKAVSGVWCSPAPLVLKALSPLSTSFPRYLDNSAPPHWYLHANEIEETHWGLS